MELRPIWPMRSVGPMTPLTWRDPFLSWGVFFLPTSHGSSPQQAALSMRHGLVICHAVGLFYFFPLQGGPGGSVGGFWGVRGSGFAVARGARATRAPATDGRRMKILKKTRGELPLQTPSLCDVVPLTFPSVLGRAVSLCWRTRARRGSAAEVEVVAPARDGTRLRRVQICFPE